MPVVNGLLAGFEENGYVILRGFLDPSVVASVREASSTLVDRLAQELVREGRLPHPFKDEPLETRMIRLYENNMDKAPTQFRENLHLPGMFPLFFHGGLLDLVEGILGPEVRLYPNYTVRPKLPEWKGTEVLWHQDGAYTKGYSANAAVPDMRMVNAWTPLVPARVENGCMEFVPGTHRLGVVKHEERQYYLEIAPEVLAPYKAKAVPIEVDPGDIVLFHNLLFHCGLPNHAKTVRWSVDWRYQDARQPTYRPHAGHLARSSAHPGSVVRDAGEWARLTFV